MPHRGEQELILSRFDGTNLLVDAAYLGPTYLRRAQNWIPGEAYRLEKRPGTTTHPGGVVAAGVTRVHALFATAYGANRYLYAVGNNAGTDTLYVSTNDGAFAALTTGTFASLAENYAFEQLHDVVYVSNGIDVPKRIPLSTAPTTSTDLTAIVSFTDGSAAPTLVADTGASLLTGTYAYSWCIFDHTAGIFLERGQTREISKLAAADQAISFPLPTGFATNGGALSSRYRAHLFLSPVNWPVELGHDQTPEGVQAGATVLRQIIMDGMPVPLRNAVRRGQTMRAYYGRLVLAVDTTSPQAAWCTATLAPGREQAYFNAGEFFPHNGRLPRTPLDVTALGVASVGERGSSAVQGVLVETTLSRTFILTGDILDDPSANYQQVSARAGCVGPKALTETPFGVFYIGSETVWCVPAGGGVPIDVGWPIRPAIKDIPPGSRARCLLWYHKGFLKAAIVPPGSTTAIHQWWLDLRMGLSSIPSWWGPHVAVAISAVAVSQVETAEADRAWHAVEGSNRVELIHQTSSFTENNGTATILAVIQTGELTAGRPFDRKVWHRLRAMAKIETSTSLVASAVVDGSSAIPLDALAFVAGTATVWDATWDATWGQSQFVEADTTMPAERPRGRSVTLQLSHSQAVGIAIREIELRYETVTRPTRSVPDMQSS